MITCLRLRALFRESVCAGAYLNARSHATACLCCHLLVFTIAGAESRMRIGQGMVLCRAAGVSAHLLIACCSARVFLVGGSFLCQIPKQLHGIIVVRIIVTLTKFQDVFVVCSLQLQVPLPRECFHVFVLWAVVDYGVLRAAMVSVFGTKAACFTRDRCLVQSLVQTPCGCARCPAAGAPATSDRHLCSSLPVRWTRFGRIFRNSRKPRTLQNPRDHVLLQTCQ